MRRAFDLDLERNWRQRFQRFERSARSVREFCRGEAIREHTFFYWRRELAKRDRLRKTAGSRTARAIVPVPRGRRPKRTA